MGRHLGDVERLCTARVTLASAGMEGKPLSLSAVCLSFAKAVWHASLGLFPGAVSMGGSHWKGPAISMRRDFCWDAATTLLGCIL